MKSSPSVAVIMATHNDDDSLGACLASLNASTHPFELYLVDDASRVPAVQYIENAPHIHLIRLKQNIGPAKARNIAINKALEAGHSFIAIMDADDTVHPQRLKKQVAFLQENPDISVVGTWANVVDEAGRHLFYLNHPTDNAAIRKALRFNSCFVHPSCMVRAEVMKHLCGYDESFPVAQDYEFFMRAAQTYKMANMPEYLLNYAWSSKSISAKKRRQQLMARLRIQKMYFNAYDLACWLGLGKTLVTSMIPRTILTCIKAKQRGS